MEERKRGSEEARKSGREKMEEKKRRGEEEKKKQGVLRTDFRRLRRVLPALLF